MKPMRFLAMLGAALSISARAWAVDQLSTNPPPGGCEAAKSPGQTDAEITRKIVIAVVRSDEERTRAFNRVKIITRDGRVSLEGHVKNDKQRNIVAAAAASVVGEDHVNNQ